MDYLYETYKVLDKILRQGGYSSISLNQVLENSGADNPFNKNFNQTKNTAIITRIVYGVIEKSITLDYFISKLYKTPPKPAIKTILKIGVYCIKFMDSIPDYAVMSGIQKLCDKLGKGAVKGFVRAVLESAVKNDIILPDKSDYQYHLSIKHSINQEIVDIICKQFSCDYEKVLSGLSSNNDTREHIRANHLLIDDTAFEQLLSENQISYEKSQANGYYLNFLNLKNSQIKDNLYTVMGFSSMYVVNNMNIKNGAEVLDCCAAPGGKALYVAQKNLYGNIVACDIHTHRVDLIEKYAKRLNAKNITTKVLNATIFNEDMFEKFDVVICDVPCSGFGTAQKKPEIKIYKTAKDIQELAKLQSQIIKNCSKYVRPGGKLYYLTCTIFKQENQDIVNAFLNANNKFKLNKLTASQFADKDGFIQLINGINADEGFFMAEMIKNA